MQDLWKYVLAILASVGGIGAIITAAVRICSNFIADRLQKKYDLKLNQELERYKAGLTNKTYISQTRFEAEFSIFRNLTGAFSGLVKAINVMIPQGYNTVSADKDERKKQDENNYKQSISSYVNAQDELNKSAPFIDKDFVENYKAIMKLCSNQLLDFEERWNISFAGTYEEKSALKTESYRIKLSR